MSKIELETQAVKQLGEQIGYGNLMSLASALWMKSLEQSGTPMSGAFIPVCSYQIKKQYLKDVNESAKLYQVLIAEPKKEVQVCADPLYEIKGCDMPKGTCPNCSN